MLKKLIWSVLWRPTRTSTTKTQKRCPFHHRGLVCKIIKSRDTWTNRHIWPWSTKWSRAKANRVLPREWTGHSKHPLPMTQEKTQHMDISRCQYWNQIDYILCSKDGVIYSKQKQDQELTGSDHELIAKFRLKLKKVGKTTRPFRYDLNRITYDYIVEVRNRFKGLDLIESLMTYRWRFVTLYKRQGSRPSPWKKCKRAKWLSEEALQIAVKRREDKRKGDKERYSHLIAELQRIAWRD